MDPRLVMLGQERGGRARRGHPAGRLRRIGVAAATLTLLGVAESGLPAQSPGAYSWVYPVYNLGVDHLTGSCGWRQYRAFDFWLGRWAVTTGEGKPAGQSEVTTDLDGCAVMEFFGGGQGRSLSAYDRASDSWSQDYVDHQGLTLRLRGRIIDGAMRMEDSIRALPSGMRLKSRFAWSIDSAGKEVRQTWWLSTDGGTTEPVNFDGRYRKNPDYRPPAPPPAVVCRDRPGYRALDGMLGTWRVMHNETEVGRATLAATAGNCLIEESYIGDPAVQEVRYRLTAFLYYDRYIDTWYRVQTDTHGRFHRLGGSVTDGALRVAGVITGPDGKPVNGTLEWRVESPDTLSQVWSVPVGPVHTRPVPQFSLRWVRVRAP